ncbi:MAG: FAD-dependent oxidoreductase [Rhodospirillales bacterium]|nr:MAG: FAD-dependent oxidoreductase [Rhodospirillales bacterium]
MIMPFDFAARSRPLNIAVIGTGVAGMSAAWLLSGRHQVTVYEREGWIGGHSNTVEAPAPYGSIPVDTGFIVYNERNYPNLVALFDHLGVPTRPSDMSFAASIDDGDLEYSGTGIGGMLAQKRNLIRPRFWRMVRDIFRFYRHGLRLLDRGVEADSVTLGAFLDDERYSHSFVYNHLLPMAAAIWSTAVVDMRDHPASAFIRFCANHGLMQMNERPQWRTVSGGSREYVRRLTARYRDRVRLGSGVRAVSRVDGQVLVTDDFGTQASYDHVVIAAHADQALTMLADPDADERAVLGAFRYARNHAVLHRDAALMPKRRKVWSSWNYLSRRRDDGSSAVCVTYWMNRLQGLDPAVPLFVTLNANRPPRPESVIATFDYDHPMFNLDAMTAQRRLWSLQGRRNTWFCGSYFGAGFHEDALQAGLAVAEALGGVRRPWTVDNESGRLHLPVDGLRAVAA